MRLSESLRKGVIESTVGGVINKFKVSTSRRDTLFFEEPIARYLLECEKAGFSDETRKMGLKWCFLTYKALLPDLIKKAHSMFLFNAIFGSIWHNLGLMDDLRLEKNDRILKIITKNEGITREIGANNFVPGCYEGTIAALTDSSARLIEMDQKKEECRYLFELDRKTISFDARPKDVYKKLNYIKPVGGYTLTDALKRNIFSLKGNMIYFRGKSVSPIENTLFHIIGDFNILPEKMTETSYAFFKEVIEENAEKEKKLSFLRTIFQIMGWGVINILVKGEGKILIVVKHPPYGLTPTDNWNYHARTFLGYLWLVDKKLKISSIKKTTFLSIEYSR